MVRSGDVYPDLVVSMLNNCAVDEVVKMLIVVVVMFPWPGKHVDYLCC
jgi:hypothetical protein